ncbi:regulatory protein RecX [Insulibacter thermoxylanivorax]|uniref:Regulatory protein RecX n=2 Tax=Insulibacter thermoxylanivorax TaxID=2749268 RepID=A0A916QBF8_9BACL|nr:regulatory protein RecX [Insulibacter thermoxylanivorax]
MDNTRFMGDRLKAGMGKSHGMKADMADLRSELPQEDQTEYEITRVEQHLRKAGHYDIYLNGEFAYTVHEDTLVTMQLLKGRKLDAADLARLEQEERINEAMDRALRWLAGRPHTEQEIVNKLRRAGFEQEDVIEAVTEKLRKLELLNDRLFAEQWLEQRVRAQKKGRNLIRHELMQKGVAKEHIDAALNALDDETEYEQALHLGLKKWRQTKGERMVRRHKTAGYLMRRGFPADIVRKVVNECAEQERNQVESDSYEEWE